MVHSLKKKIKCIPIVKQYPRFIVVSDIGYVCHYYMNHLTTVSGHDIGKWNITYKNRDMKNAGLVCDNYKVAQFKRELDSKGFKYTEFPYKHPGAPEETKDLTIIKIEYDETQFAELSKLIKKVNDYFDSIKN